MWFAFTSSDGRVVGVVRCKGESGAPQFGVAMAVLETPCTLPEWRSLLMERADMYEAAEQLIEKKGGCPIFKIVPIQELHWTLASVVGEA